MWNVLSMILYFAVSILTVYPVINIAHWMLPHSAYQNPYVHQVLLAVYTSLGYMHIPQTEVNADILMSVLLLLFVGVVNGLIFPRIPGLKHISFMLRGEYVPIQEEKEKMDSVKKYVEEKSGQTLDGWEFYVSNWQSYNAYTTGYKHIAITQPMLDHFPVPAIAGVVAHEMGHYMHGDTKAIGVSVSFLLVGNLCFDIIRWAAKLLNLLRFIPVLGLLTIFMSIILSLFLRAYNVFVRIPFFVVNFFARRIEFAADSYAAELNLGSELIWGLDILRKIAGDGTGWSALFSDHPNVAPRIEKLKQKLPQESEEDKARRLFSF